MLRRNAAVLLAMLVIAGVVVAGQQVISDRAFGSLEAQTVSGDATRVAVALSYEIRLLSNYGSTNAMWDSSYTDVSTRDAATFATDFPPTDLVQLYDVDAAVGIDATGRVMVGGRAVGDRFAALPPEITPAVLTRMADVHAPAAQSSCGAVLTAAMPYLYCGFSARRTDGSAPRPYGLVFLRGLDPATIARLSQSTSMSLRLAERAGHTATVRLSTPIGTLAAGTDPISADKIELDMTLPALGGRTLALLSVHGRPIRSTAQRSAAVTLIFMSTCGAILALLVLLLVLRSVRAQVGPLRVTTEEIITSGDPTVRLPAAGRGEIAALGATINSMLDTLARQAAAVEREQAENASRIEESYRRQQDAEAQARERAQALIDSTARTVVGELTEVLEQAQSVQAAAGDIGARTAEADQVTATVQEGAGVADSALGQLTGEMDRVRSITTAITEIAGQTRMLALNATIEAERAGEYGTGFAVVAGEVKELAGTTAASATKISHTTEAVTAMTGEVASTIADLTSGVSVIGQATASVSGVAAQQATTVASLVEMVRAAISRVDSMSSITEDMERRGGDRIPAVGVATVEISGQEVSAELRDLSETGLQVRLPSGSPPATEQAVTVTLPDRYGRHRLGARVSWTRGDRGGTLVGLRLVAPDPDYSASVRKLRYRTPPAPAS